jgi:predicted AAA+ superfamily ATPase
MLEKTTKELRSRNKIIRIADKYGWDVVVRQVNSRYSIKEKEQRLVGSESG